MSFDAFESKFQSLAAAQAELQARVANQEQASSELEVCMIALEAKCTELAGRNTQLHTKVLDLEARSREAQHQNCGDTRG
jgi:peptidoglycan hydrolase CwlO-like protein